MSSKIARGCIRALSYRYGAVMFAVILTNANLAAADKVYLDIRSAKGKQFGFTHAVHFTIGTQTIKIPARIRQQPVSSSLYSATSISINVPTDSSGAGVLLHGDNQYLYAAPLLFSSGSRFWKPSPGDIKRLIFRPMGLCSEQDYSGLANMRVVAADGETQLSETRGISGLPELLSRLHRSSIRDSSVVTFRTILHCCEWSGVVSGMKPGGERAGFIRAATEAYAKYMEWAYSNKGRKLLFKSALEYQRRQLERVDRSTLNESELLYISDCDRATKTHALDLGAW